MGQGPLDQNFWDDSKQQWIKTDWNSRTKWETDPNTEPDIYREIEEANKTKPPNKVRVEADKFFNECKPGFDGGCVPRNGPCPPDQEPAFCCFPEVSRHVQESKSIDGSVERQIRITVCKCYKCVPKCPNK